MSATAPAYKALGRVQNFVALLYHFIIRLDTEGEWEKSDTGWNELHAQFFEDMTALRQEIQNGRALAAIVKEYAARQDDLATAVAVMQAAQSQGRRPVYAGPRRDNWSKQLAEAVAASKEAHAILLDAAKELRGDGRKEGDEG